MYNFYTMHKDIDKKGKLFVISGSSGVGKGTLLQGLLKNNSDMILSISATTRKPRNGEKDEVNYFFVTKEEFQKEIENNEFLEWAEFNGNFYGTRQKYVEKKLNEGKNLILEIETRGAFQIKKKLPDTVLIFILPPSLEELEKRLRGRNTEDEETILGRLHEAFREIECSKDYDYKIVNDNLEKALEDLQNIINKNRL